MPSLSHRMVTIRPNLGMTVAGKAPAALAAAAGATDGQGAQAGDPEDHPSASEDEEKPPAANDEEPEASDEEEEQANGSGYTSDDLADFNADDFGMKKLMGMCEVKNSIAHEIKLRGGRHPNLQRAPKASTRTNTVHARYHISGPFPVKVQKYGARYTR